MREYKPKHKICVSGAAETEHCGEGALELAKELGREIVRHDGVLVTGATTGIPYWAAIGAKEEGGISIGLSPAVSEKEHINVYHLPTDYFDVIRRKNEIVLRPVEVRPKGAVLEAVRQKIKRLGLTEKDVETALRWVRDARAPA
jgi:predicted Rossmann-fold nucleotide-binding protein